VKKHGFFPRTKKINKCHQMQQYGQMFFFLVRDWNKCHPKAIGTKGKRGK
jgi:hypothetical protein